MNHVATLPPIRVEIPGKIWRVFVNPDGSWRPSLYKVLHGGRGSAKSESIARLLLGEARSRKQRALCTRMYQTSVGDSVIKTLEEAAVTMDLIGNPRKVDEFEIQKTTIIHKITGSDFLFKGLQRDISSIKSMKGVRRMWVEEAEPVSKYMWQTIEPTMREPGAEIWVSYNPDDEQAATHQQFVVKPRRAAIVEEVNWRDNPFFPEILNQQRIDCMVEDPDAYDWIWEGHCRKITDAIIFRNRVSFEAFDEPDDVRPFYGLDFGESADPNAGVRSYIKEVGGREHLFITHEAFGWRVELDDVAALLDGDLIQGQGLPDARDWPLKCDASRPGMISKLVNDGFNASAAAKWSGAVEDGIAHLKAFKQIHVHPRCVNIAREFRLYSYKTDAKMLDEKGQPAILPIIVDRWNHGIDALRYSLDGYIEQGGLGLGVWGKLAR